MTGPVVIRSGDGWEIVNDDGFIYKRRKRELNLAPEAHELPNQPQLDVHWRRNRKKATLQQLKYRYVTEIEEWEKLFQKLDKATETKIIQKDFPGSEVSETSIVDVSEQKFKTKVEKLSYQVIQLEKFMEDLRILCYDAEHICKPAVEYRELIMSPRVLVDGLGASNEVPCDGLEEQDIL